VAVAVNAKHQPRNVAVAVNAKHQPRNVAVAVKNVKLPKAERNVVVKLIVISQKR
jgi:hypothetical protein